MNTRQSKAVTKPAAAPEQFVPWNLFADFGRQQASVATEASNAVLRGFEAMQKIQQEASTAQGDWQSAARYWRDMTAAALEMQVEVMGCATHLVDSETALEAASAVEAFDAFPMMKGFFPFAAAGRQAWQRNSAR